ncbi:IS3 family transposase [Streptomyces sp. NPDC007189]|uniref:IS3 family transposase n=1 Tax=unclassified Streptomyces TaxID=2593676 RepID=UPI0033C6CFE0
MAVHNLALVEYIDAFCRSRRIQNRIGYLSPTEFEETNYADRATTEPVKPGNVGGALCRC